MTSADARAILAQIPYDFYGGEICLSIGTLHNIHLIHDDSNDTQRMRVSLSILKVHVDRYSSDDDMNSSKARAILTQIPLHFNGGEICMSIGTLHNIHVRQHVDRSYLINSESILKDR
jgi:hypothetical protein